jgi:ferredoxin
LRDAFNEVVEMQAKESDEGANGDEQMMDYSEHVRRKKATLRDMKCYSCPRCGYTTSVAMCMRRHLKRKRQCPSDMNEEITCQEALIAMFGDSKHAPGLLFGTQHSARVLKNSN